MQIREQISHLRVCESASERRHHAFPRQDGLRHLLIARRRSAGQNRLQKEAVQIGRNLFEAKVVVLVAVRASHIVEMLSGQLLRRQFPFGSTAGK